MMFPQAGDLHLLFGKGRSCYRGLLSADPRDVASGRQMMQREIVVNRWECMDRRTPVQES